MRQAVSAFSGACLLSARRISRALFARQAAPCRSASQAGLERCASCFCSSALAPHQLVNGPSPGVAWSLGHVCLRGATQPGSLLTGPALGALSLPRLTRPPLSARLTAQPASADARSLLRRLCCTACHLAYPSLSADRPMQQGNQHSLPHGMAGLLPLSRFSFPRVPRWAPSCTLSLVSVRPLRRHLPSTGRLAIHII